MSLTLINKRSRMRVFVLPHDPYCTALGRCVCVVLPGRENRSVPSSVTLAAGATLSGLPDALLTVPDITLAVRKGEILMTQEPTS